MWLTQKNLCDCPQEWACVIAQLTVLYLLGRRQHPLAVLVTHITYIRESFWGFFFKKTPPTLTSTSQLTILPPNHLPNNPSKNPHQKENAPPSEDVRS